MRKEGENKKAQNKKMLKKFVILILKTMLKIYTHCMCKKRTKENNKKIQLIGQIHLILFLESSTIKKFRQCIILVMYFLWLGWNYWFVWVVVGLLSTPHKLDIGRGQKASVWINWSETDMVEGL